MKAVLLGTGADHCIPAFRCTCKTCTDARIEKGRKVRKNSCLLIESESGEYLLIDMPPQILTMLAENNIDDSRIDTVLITHRHEDHTLGTRYLFQASEKRNFKVKEPLTVYLPESALRSLSGKFLSDKKETKLRSRPDYYQIRTVNPGNTITKGIWKITALETGHLTAKKSSAADEESFAYVIEDNKGAICVYYLDSAIRIPEQTLAYLKKLNINCLIGDCTYEKTSASSGHMDIEALIKLKDILQPKRTIASHISHMNLDYNSLKNRLSRYSIELSYDGMTLEI